MCTPTHTSNRMHARTHAPPLPARTHMQSHTQAAQPPVPRGGPRVDAVSAARSEPSRASGGDPQNAPACTGGVPRRRGGKYGSTLTMSCSTADRMANGLCKRTTASYQYRPFLLLIQRWQLRLQSGYAPDGAASICHGIRPAGCRLLAAPSCGPICGLLG